MTRDQRNKLLLLAYAIYWDWLLSENLEENVMSEFDRHVLAKVSYIMQKILKGERDII